MEIEQELQLIRQNRAPGPDPALAAVPPSIPPAPITKPGYEDLEEPETGLPAPPPAVDGFWDVFGAAWTSETIRTDSWNYRQKQRQSLVQEMFDLLPDADKRELAARPFTRGSGWAGVEGEVVQRAAALASASPEAASQWAGYPLTMEAFDQQIDLARKRDLQEAEAITGQSGGVVAEFLGGSARAMTDEASLALFPLGGFGGSALRTIATESALGFLGEAAVLPREFEVAEELDLPDPSVAQRLALGAAFGAAVPAAFFGVGKGVEWYRARRAGVDAARPPGADPVEFEHGVEVTERAMRDEPTPEMALTPDARREGTLGAILADGKPNVLPGAESLPYNEGATIRAIIGVESGGNPTARNPKSTATGAGQFIASTWLDMMRRYRPERIEGLNLNQILDLRNEGDLSVEMTAYYARENTAKMQEAGITVGPAEVYLAHFMGPGDAIRALTVPLDTPISQIMSPAAIAANKGIRFNGKSLAEFTVGDLRGWSMRKMRSAYDPNAIADLPQFDSTSRGYTGSGQVRAGDEFTIDVQYEVVDLSSVQRATGDLQPRDRSRIASDAWIADTAARLDPAQLMRSPTADRGAPIVGPDGVIESGNGRYGAIARAYERHPDRAAAYRQQIEAEGFAIPADVRQPLLIARRTSELTPEERPRFAIAAQDSGGAVMTSTEMARASSRAMSGPVLAQLDPTRPLTDGANGGFVRSVLQGLPRSARNAMFDKDGLLNAEGRKQLREALFARAWPDKDIIERHTEGDPGELRSLLEALDTAAPAWAALRADIETGLVRPEMDISGHVLDAMRMIAAARELASRDGMPIANALKELLEEVDLLEGPVAPLTAALVRKFWTNGRAAKAEEVASFLTRYAEDARKVGAEGGMFDAPGPRDVLVAIDREAFGDLPEDLGNVRAVGRPEDAARAAEIAAEPVEGFDAGAMSPEAQAVREEIRADLDAPPAAPTGSRAPKALKVPKAAQRMASWMDDGREISTMLEGMTAAERAWLKKEWQSGRLERRHDPMLRQDTTYRRPRPDMDPRWQVSDAFDPATAPMYREDTEAAPDALLTQAEGPFGPVFSGLTNQPEAAIARLLDAKEGEVPDAFIHPDPEIGPISFVWGEYDPATQNGYGLKKILLKHGMKVVQDLPAALRAGVPQPINNGRIQLDVPNLPGARFRRSVIKLEWSDKPKTWLVTSHDVDPAEKSARQRKREKAGQTRTPNAQSDYALSEVPQATDPEVDIPGTVANQAEDDAAAAMIAAARAEFEAMRAEGLDDLTIDLPDGTTLTLREALDDLDADEGFDAFVQACAITPNGGAQ